jgi:hypothetical protein
VKAKQTQQCVAAFWGFQRRRTYFCELTECDTVRSDGLKARTVHKEQGFKARSSEQRTIDSNKQCMAGGRPIVATVALV